MENGIGQELRLSQTEDIYNVTIYITTIKC